MYTKRFKPKRKIRANINVQTRKLYESISHKLGKPTFQFNPSYMHNWSPISRKSDWQPISRKRDWRLEVSPERTLGICIMCHGSIGYNKTHPIIDVPDGINLIKKNLGGCGNFSYGIYKIDFALKGSPAVTNLFRWKDTKISKPIDISDKVKLHVNEYTLKTLTNFDSCIDKQSYDEFVSTKIENPFPSCEIFHGPRFYSKIYSFAPYKTEMLTYTNNYIMFTYLSPSGVKSINIVTCTQDELNDFFETKDSPITTEFMKIKQDRIEKKVLKLTTENIFALIEHASESLGITNVNMLDLSCNTFRKPFRRNSYVGY